MTTVEPSWWKRHSWCSLTWLAYELTLNGKRFYDVITSEAYTSTDFLRCWLWRKMKKRNLFLLMGGVVLLTPVTTWQIGPILQLVTVLKKISCKRSSCKRSFTCIIIFRYYSINDCKNYHPSKKISTTPRRISLRY